MSTRRELEWEAQESRREPRPNRGKSTVNSGRKTGQQSTAQRTVRTETVASRSTGYRRMPEQNYNRRRRKRRKSSAVLLLPVLVIVLLFVIYLLLPGMFLKAEATLEAGEEFPGAKLFSKTAGIQAKLITQLDTEQLSVGEYTVEVSLLGRKKTCTLHVVDTVAPVFTVQDVTIMKGNTLQATDFVTNITDASQCKVEFKTAPDFSYTGDQTVNLVVTDAGGNFAADHAKLTIITDTTPPVISGVSDQTITVGDSISYKKGVEVTDDIDSNVALEIDNSAVDTNKIGDYTVNYTATDKAGNQTQVSAVIHVKPKEKAPDEVATVTQEYVEAEADRILYKITNSQMSQYEIIKAIYDWCHEKIAYSDGASKNDWVQGAYDGLVNRRGDCYTYAMTAKVLLTRAGIKNKDIEKIPTKNTMHYWNLVDIGEGWHHFDTCRRADKSTFFYKTDAELMEYSNSHNGTHNYDRTIYTDIQ